MTRLTNTQSWTEYRGRSVTEQLEECWEALADLHTTGALSEAQLHHLDRLVEEMPDTALGQNLALRLLHRAIEHPSQVGVNVAAAWARFSCPCGDTGLVETSAKGQGHYRPCERCNPGGHRIWRECHLTGCRGCDTCRPGSRRRGMQGDHRAESAEARSDAQRRAVLDGLA